MMQRKIAVFLVMVLVTLSCNTPFAKNVPPTSTPAATAIPTLPPAPTATPTLVPTPTPQPAVRVEQAEQSIFSGNYEDARKQFQEAQSNATDPEIRAAADYGIGRALYLSRNYSTAIDTLKAMIETYPQSSNRANAYFFLALSYEATQTYDLAAEAYTKFIEVKPGVIDAYIQEQRGDDYMAAANPTAAVEAYTAAIQAPQDGTTIWTELKLGKAYAGMGDFSNAIKQYLDIYEKSDNDYARAQANLLMGQAYLTMGMPEQANARFLDSVASFPKAYDSYTGLVTLISSGVSVDELSRGMVDYYAGQYGLAIEAFNRYIDAGGDNLAKAHYYRAFSYQELNQPEDALKDWDQIINNFQSDSLWAAAWDEKAYTLWAYLDKFDEAAATLIKYVDQVPDSTLAPGYLFQAARILERNNRFADAAATWERLIDTYPSADQSYRGLFLAGVSYFRAADYAKALTVFQRALVLAGTPGEQAAAQLWTGKVYQAQGDANAAKTAWEQGAQVDPTGYYSERSNELLQNRTPFQIDQPVDLGYDLENERPKAEVWLRTTFNLTPDTQLDGLGDLASDARILRGKAFWELGLYDLARDEYENVRQAVATDPVQTYRLMNDMLQHGMYRSAILASRQILDLANLDDVGTLKAPEYFNHIRFGVYFKDLILQISQNENFHPLLVLSVMRQESMFEGFADSGAGARGLMQIMPETGKEIASSISWPEDFVADDLYRPEVSITLGTRYLARQRDLFNNSIYAALAAYNGGPGNTIIWKQLAGDDPDLLLEVIRADETRKYIMQIYEFFNIYRLIYQRGY
jgi:soluble lytic murein transglycosylase